MTNFSNLLQKVTQQKTCKAPQRGALLYSFEHVSKNLESTALGCFTKA